MTSHVDSVGGFGTMCATSKRKLPIGIQTFREIREEGHYYVDKAQFAGQLVDEGKHYLLARPRRFGKSLLVDTLKELFEGNKTLFRSLAIYDGWDWAVRYPVVRLSTHRRNYNNVLLTAERIFGYGCSESVSGNNHAEKKSFRDHAYRRRSTSSEAAGAKIYVAIFPGSTGPDDPLGRTRTAER